MVRYYVQPGVLTENGWPMVNASSTVSVQVVPAAKKVPLLRGDVATILNAFIIAYNRDVEKINTQIWGWSPYNDVWNSNHMSGTAIDIEAPRYPWGQRRMSEATKNRVRNLLLKFEGVVYWGANWSYPDEMHFQIGLPPSNSRVRALATKLNNGYLDIYKKSSPAPPVTPPKKEEDMSLTPAQDERLNQTLALVEENNSILKDIMVQLGQPGGHPQGGSRTLYDVASAVAAKSGVPNTYDTLAPKEES